VDGLIRVLVCLADLVHLVGEGAAGRNIGEHHVTVVGEKRLCEPVAFAGLSRDVELHH